MRSLVPADEASRLGAVLGTDRFLAEINVTANLQHPNLTTDVERRTRGTRTR